jgi:hypothetical protein
MKTLSNRIVALAVLLVATTVVSQARAQQIAPPAGAEGIAVPDGNRPYLVLHARGTQTYTCTPEGTWNPASVPQADLFFDNATPMGTHFGGPTWQLRDGSYVKAAKLKGMTPDPNSIAWLLLQMTQAGAGPDGDRLAKTTFIQRVNTVGGMPPMGGCSAGATVSIPYEADYYFYCADSGN